ncbi:Uncharacterised protein [Vibrio cholerae]|nr:Uncharacterised protein [Vibrio cholerae]
MKTIRNPSDLPEGLLHTAFWQLKDFRQLHLV